MMEGSGASRKLGPIYDALEHKQYKLAYKLAKQATQKYPKHLGLRALYAVTLERLGKVNEGVEVGRDVLREMRTPGGGGKTGKWEWTGRGRGEHADHRLQGGEEAGRTPVHDGGHRVGGKGTGVRGSAPVPVQRLRSHLLLLKMQQCAMKLFKKTQDETYLFWESQAPTWCSTTRAEGRRTCLRWRRPCAARPWRARGAWAGSVLVARTRFSSMWEVLFAQGKTAEAMRALREAREKGAKTRLMGSQANMLECALCLEKGTPRGRLGLAGGTREAKPRGLARLQVLAMLLVAGPGECGDECGGSHLPQTMDAVVSVNPLDKAERMAADMGRGEGTSPR